MIHRTKAFPIPCLRKKKFKMLLLNYFTLCLALNNCGGKDDTISGSGAAFGSIDGTWKTKCITGTTPVINTIVADQVNLTSTLVTYSDQSCFLMPLSVRRKSGTYQIGAPLTSISNTKEINVTYDGEFLTPSTAAVAQLLIDNLFCGITDWKAGVELEITGKNCTGITTQNKGDVRYNIVKIDGTGAGSTLTIGDLTSGQDGSSPEKRPTTLSTTVSYVK